MQIFDARVLIDAQMRRPTEFIEEHRATKRTYVRELLSRPRSPAPTFEAEVKKQKEAFILERFVAPAARVVAAQREGRIASLVDLEHSDSGLWLLREVKKLVLDRCTLADFLSSSDIFRVPFLDVYCSLYAAVDFYQRERRPRESDFDDVPFLATALPYCQIVTMDGGMYDLCRKAKLDEKYAFDPCRPTVDDVERLIARLSA